LGSCATLRWGRVRGEKTSITIPYTPEPRRKKKGKPWEEDIDNERSMGDRKGREIRKKILLFAGLSLVMRRGESWATNIPPPKRWMEISGKQIRPDS